MSKATQKITHFLTTGEALIFLATTVAAIGWVASKEVITAMSPTLFMGIRFVLAALVLLPLCYSDIRYLARKTVLQTLVLGVLLAVALNTWIYALSISETMGEGAFIMTTAVLLSPLVGWVLFQTPPGRAFWVTLPVAVIGVACLSLNNGWQFAAGQLFFLASAFLLSVHFNFNKYFSGKVRTLPLVCLQLFAAGGFSLLIAIPTGYREIEMTAAIWGWLALSIVICTSLRYVLQTTGQHRVSTSTAALMMILEPIWVLFFGMMLYDERLPLQKFIGCVLIVIALLLYRRKR